MKKWEELTLPEQAAMMKVAVQNGIYDLPTIRQKYNEFAEGGNLFGGGGYTSSDVIRKRITEFEGTAMTGAKDPLSGKYGTNRSFEAEDKSFYNALPESIREQVLGNPQLADNLYSYSYNVGAGNFRKRVVPTLEKYYQGQATIKDIENSMWASGDKKLRGLRRRRSVEREGVRNALLPTLTQYEAPPVSTQVFTPFPLIQQNTRQLPVMEPDTDSYITAHQVTPAEQRRQKLRESIEAVQRFNNLMQMIGIENNLLPTYTPETGTTLFDILGTLNSHADGGNLYDGTTQPTQQMQVGRKMGAPYYDYSVEGHPITRNAVEPLQEIIVIGKKPKSWFERVGDAVKDTDVAYIENPAVMTAAGHTAKISQAHKPTKEERRLGDNLAIIGAAGAAVESAPAVASALAPGSSFWMNPITQQIAKSTLGGTAFDAASTVITGSTIGGNVRDFIGYQPSNEWTRLGYNLATDMFNPGYSYGSVRLGWDLLPSPLIPKRGSMQMNHGRNFGEFNPDTWNNWGSESLTLLGNKYAVKVPKTTRTSEDVGPKVFDDMGWRYRAFINSKLAANKIPGFEPYEYIGFHTIKGGYTPVFRQKKLIQKGTQTPEDIKFNEEALADVENAMSKSSGLWKSWNVGDYNLGHNIGKNAEGIGKLFDATYSREPITWFMQNFPRKWEVSPTNNTRILNSILKNYDNE